MEALANKVKNLEVSLSERIHQIEQKTDEIEHKMRDFLTLSPGIDYRKGGLKRLDSIDTVFVGNGEISRKEFEKVFLIISTIMI